MKCTRVGVSANPIRRWYTHTLFNTAIPIYKSDWTDARSIENAILYFLDVMERRKRGERLAPFHVERLDYRTRDMEAFYRGLERNGPKAVREFRAVFG